MAGRLYFEASIYGESFVSFSTNAFIDEDGYEEPVRKDVTLARTLRVVIPLVVVALILMVFMCYRYYKKQERIKQENEKLQKFRRKQAIQKEQNERNKILSQQRLQENQERLLNQ